MAKALESVGVMFSARPLLGRIEETNGQSPSANNAREERIIINQLLKKDTTRKIYFNGKKTDEKHEKHERR